MVAEACLAKLRPVPAVDCGRRATSLQCLLVLSVLVSLSCVVLVCKAALAEESIFISIGPRMGFSGKTPLLGKQQKENFRLYDVAALFRLPWQMPLGTNWKLETRLIASAGALEGGGETGLMATLVPDIALSGWNGLVSFDV